MLCQLAWPEGRPRRRRLDSWSWTPDGESLLINEAGDDIGLVRTNGDRVREAVLDNPGYGEGTPEISPDGRWMAYRSNESGQYEIYVRPFPDVEAGKWQVSTSTTGGQYPAWSPDGSELFYRTLDGTRLMGVRVETEPQFSADIPRVAVEGSYVFSPGDGRNWDIAPDGQRFLFVKDADEPAGGAAGSQIVIVENWFTELRERVPVD